MGKPDRSMENCTIVRSDEATQTLGRVYMMTAIMEILEKHGQEFRKGALSELMNELPSDMMLGPFSVEDIDLVLLDHCSESSQESFEFHDWAFVKFDRALRSKFVNEIIRKWADAGYVEIGVNADGEMTWQIMVINHGESLEEFAPRLLKLLLVVL